MKMSRSTFLKLSGAAVAGTCMGRLAKFVPDGMSTLDEAFDKPARRDVREHWEASHCTLCPQGCALQARILGDGMLGIRPNPGGAKGRGGSSLCLKAFALQQAMYHPGRLTVPMRRDASGTSRISWASGLQEAAKAFRDDPGRWAVLTPGDASLSSALFRSAALAAGGKAYTMAWEQGDGPLDALALATGRREAGYDFEGCSTVCAFGADWLQSSAHPAEAYRGFGMLRGARQRGRMIIVAPRFGLTCLKSDAWIPCAVGMEGAAAMGVAGILLRRGLMRGADAKGLDRVKRELLRDFAPESMAELSGVPMDKLEWLAEQLSDHGPALVMGTRGRLCDQWATVLVATLAGGIGHAGGIQAKPALNWGVVLPGAGASELPHQERLLRDMQSGAVRSLLLVDANPAFASPEPERWRKALRELPLSVSLATRMDASAGASGIVLPLAVGPERGDFWPDDGDTKGWGRAAAAVKPMGEARSPGEVAVALAEAMGARPPLAWSSFGAACDSLGGKLKQGRSKGARTVAVDFTAWSGPLWKAPTFTDGDYHLLPYSPPAFSYARGGELPYLRSTISPVLRTWWTTVVEINPADAGAQGIADGAKVVVESRSGRINAMAKLFAGVPRGAVSMPLGGGEGHEPGLGEVGDAGADADSAALVSCRIEEGGSVPLWSHEKVRISPA